MPENSGFFYSPTRSRPSTLLSSLFSWYESDFLDWYKREFPDSEPNDYVRQYVSESRAEEIARVDS